MIALVRVDNRLLHGQILEAWVPRLRARRVVVVDEEAAASPLAQAAMCLCVPPDLPADVVAPGAADFAALAAAPEPVLVLFRDVRALARAVASGALTPARAPRVNVGNVHYAPGRRPVSASVFLDAEEAEAVAALARRGFEVEARAIPADAPLSAAQIAEKWAAAGGKR